MVRGGHRAGHQRAVALVAVAHDVFVLVVLPLEEGLVHRGDVEARVVGGVDQLLDVLALELEHFLGVLQGFFLGAPGQVFGVHRL
ncbi:hypothetical protein D3C81_2094120 [compost metagenome]